jgi:hypothetical protein
MQCLQSYGSSNDNIIFSSEFFENNLFFKLTVLHQIGSDPKKIYFTTHSDPWTISLQKISQFCWPPRNRQGGPSGEWLIYSMHKCFRVEMLGINIENIEKSDG